MKGPIPQRKLTVLDKLPLPAHLHMLSSFLVDLKKLPDGRRTVFCFQHKTRHGDFLSCSRLSWVLGSPGWRRKHHLQDLRLNKCRQNM
jgi:hypothetical protein